MIEYNVYRGVYPFDELLGSFTATNDADPEVLMTLALHYFGYQDTHPVVAPA